MTEPLESSLSGQDRVELTLEVTGDLLTQAAQLRAFSMPSAEAGLPVIHQALVALRTHLDQLESVWGHAIDLKDSAAMAARQAEQVAQDAWDDEADRARRRGRAEYEGAQERYAYFRLKTREQWAVHRTAQEIADLTATCEKKIHAMYRGLDGARIDLHRRIGAASWESSLERT